MSECVRTFSRAAFRCGSRPVDTLNMKTHHGFWTLLCGWICLLMFLFPFPLFAGNGGLREKAPSLNELGTPYFHNFSPKEYGAFPQNWAIVQDKRGVIYIGNNAGLLEYDGIRWRVIPTQNKTVVRSLTRDETGRIYVGAVGEIGYLAPDVTGNLCFVSLNSRLDKADRAFSEVFRTHATPQGVFFQSRERIFLYNQGRFQVWKAKQPFHRSWFIDGRFFVRQLEVGLLELRNGQLCPIPGSEQLAQEKNYVMLPWGSNQILVGTRIQGLFLFDGRTFLPFRTEADAFLKANVIYCGTLLADGTLALGTMQGGLALLDREGRLLRVWDRAVGLRDHTIYALYPDAGNGLWLAMSNGITCLEWPSSLTRFQAASGLEGTVSALHRHAGVLYAGTTQGVFTLAGARFMPIEGIKSQSWAFLPVKDGLFLANNGGVYEIRGQRARLIRASDTNTLSILPSRLNPARIYIGLQNGLASVKRMANESWVDEGKLPGITESAQTLVEARDGSLWLGTVAQGVLRVRFPREWSGASSSPARVERFDISHGLPSRNHCYAFEIDGSPVFATHEGIYHFNEGHGRFESDPRFAGLFKEGPLWVLTLHEDGRSRVWLSTMNEAARTNRVGVASRQADGTYAWDPGPFLRFADHDTQAIWVDQEGVAWFGGPEGLIRFDPTLAKDRDQPMTALVRRVATHEGRVLFGGSVTADISAIPKLKYADNTLRFEFAAPSFDGAEANRYQVLMEGLDKSWSPWSAEAFKDFTNLSEGRYTFRVRARNVYGAITQEGTYAFRVLSPWYRTVWAYLVYLLGGSVALWGFIHWRLALLRARNAQLEAKVRERTLELEISERKAQEATLAKSRFLASMSHELRTPLNAILGFAQLMRRDQSLHTKAHEQLGRIHRAGEHLLGLINDVLSISKIEAGKLTLNAAPFSLGGMIQGITEMIGVRAQEKGLELIVQISDSLPDVVEGDEGKLRQVLLNLLGNAVKFTDQGEITLRLTSHQGLSRFEVQDTGAGIRPGELKTLFAAFAQTETGRKAKEGTGLGLHISQVMVKLMGGEIQVESEIGKGTRFAFELPLKEAQAQVTPRTDRLVQGLREGQGSPKVLVADDRMENRELLRELMEGWGFEVREVEDGWQALEAWESWEPCLIWMDLRMPRLNGFEAVSRIRKEERASGRPRTPVFALSASVFDSERKTVVAFGFDEFIHKPFQEEELATSIEKHTGLRFHRTEVETSQETGLSPNALADQDPVWVDLFRVALRVGDSEQALDLIQGLKDPMLAKTLQSLIEGYRFEELLKMMDKIERTEVTR